MATYKLISTTQIKSYTSLTANVTDSKYEHWIEYAQRTHLEKILGSTLLGELEAAQLASNLTADQTTLVDDYIVPFLAWLVYWYALPDLWATVTKTGVQTKSFDDGDSVDSRGLSLKLKTAENAYKEYQDRLIDYLINNTDKFQSYNTTTSTDERIFSTNTGGFVFGKSEAKNEFDRINGND